MPLSLQVTTSGKDGDCVGNSLSDLIPGPSLGSTKVSREVEVEIEMCEHYLTSGQSTVTPWLIWSVYQVRSKQHKAMTRQACIDLYSTRNTSYGSCLSTCQTRLQQQDATIFCNPRFERHPTSRNSHPQQSYMLSESRTVNPTYTMQQRKVACIQMTSDRDAGRENFYLII